ncbi:MAG TPA: hypothetical protein DIC53_11815 [Synergistaceae bacterium]|jgi:gluconate kinase|nr:hypothetical protein [Synergistaceae bacterium]
MVISPDTPLNGIRVIAFVGPAGTGKSQRAQMVAQAHEVDYIIDDGLVIAKGRIMAGKSAKSEKNLVRAIRRAVFEFPEHKQTVRDFLRAKSPAKVMVVATSISMAEIITRALGISSPERFIDITEVASPEEILKARRERHEKGHHVVPVSRTQLRRNFAGTLVGHLLDFFMTTDREERERTIVHPPFTFFGTLTISTSAIADIARHVCQASSQIAAIKDIKVRSNDDVVSLEASITVRPGRLSFLQIGTVHQKKVASAIRYYTGMDTDKVDIRIVEVELE